MFRVRPRSAYCISPFESLRLRESRLLESSTPSISVTALSTAPRTWSRARFRVVPQLFFSFFKEIIGRPTVVSNSDLASSPRARACFTKSLRRSSVSAGSGTRIKSPLFAVKSESSSNDRFLDCPNEGLSQGLTPTSEARALKAVHTGSGASGSRSSQPAHRRGRKHLRVQSAVYPAH